MLKKILISLAAVIAVFVVVVSLQPSTFRVTRSATLAAPPTVVHALVNDFHSWDAWSPWAKIDPAMKTAFEGPTSGPGATYSWSGNNDVGAGRMTIIESRPSELFRIKLEFLKPFAATNTTDFTFKSEGNQTTVTWAMFGDQNFLAKAFGLFVDCDKMIGADFEKGLASMKTVAEAAAKAGTTIATR